MKLFKSPRLLAAVESSSKSVASQMLRLRILFLLPAVACVLAGCDPMWIRGSIVEVGPRGFPVCVDRELRLLGIVPEMHQEPDGSQRLVASYMSGALNITANRSSSGEAQVVTLQLIGHGNNPAKDLVPAISEGLGRVSSAIANSCSTNRLR